MRLKLLLIMIALFVGVGTSYGQILIPSSTPVTQNFDGIGNSATATLPTGIRVNSTANYTTGTTATTVAAGTSGTGILTGSSTGGVYNFANGVTASSTDRALGFLTTGAYISPRSIIIEIKNTGSTNITDLTIAFDYEKYRSGTRQLDLTFVHGATASLISTAAATGNQTYAADTNNTVISNPPLTTSKTVTLTGLSIAPNGLYYLCWTFTGLAGSTNGQGVGVDNISLTATFVSACTDPSLAFTTATLTGFTYVNGSGPSSNQTYTVSGANLSADILLTAPTDYEISTTSSSGFGSSITLTQTSGTVATTTIYVRLKAGLAVASYNSENVAAASTGATTKNVACSGNVTAPLVCGSESFANICTSSCMPTNSTYGTRNWTGDDLGLWTATLARTDQTITGSAITIRDGVLTSPTYSTGIGNLTFKTKFPFSESSGSLTIAVNGTTVGTVTYAEMNGTTPITKSITGINVSGNIVLTITSATARFTIDDISWTCYASCAPTVTTPTATVITTTTATLGGNLTSIGCSSVTIEGIEWSTTSGFANGTGTQVATSGSFATGVFIQPVTGLPSGTVIYYKAFATNLTGTAYSGIGSFTTPITNDLCNGTIGLTVNAVAKASIMTGSTATTPFAEKDVWFSFTPSCSGTHNIKVTGFSGDIDIELYNVACPTPATYLDNSSGTTATETITSSLTAGATYYLRVLAWDTTAATSAFTAQVTSDSTLTINNTGSPATGFIIAGTTNVVLMGFTTTPNCATSYNLTGVTISKTGNSTTSDISNLRIFYDANSNGIVDGGETSVSGTGIALSASLAFTLSGQTGITTTRNYLLVADVAVSATGGNLFTGKITTSANLTAVLSPTGTVTGIAAGNTQTITYAGAEINVTNSTPSSIPTGSAANTGYNTQFAATAIGASTAAKTYRIYNLGSSTLNVSAVTSSNPTEFTVTSSTPYTIAPGAYVSFTVIFTPSSSGTRSAVISIANNDSTNDGALTENPYTFSVKGDGTCVATINTITPTSGPIGTEVTINSAGDLIGATVTFNGISATVVQTSLNQIKVFVPVGATSGNLVTTNSIGCSSTNAFTVIKNVGNSCEGGSLASDLFISEVTDSNYGGLTYVEIYNGTGVTKNLSGYSINTASNGGVYSGTPVTLNNVNLASGSTYVIALGDDDLCTSPGGDGSLAAQVVPSLGINFDPYQNTSPPKGNDHIALFNGATQIDSWGVFGNPSWATSTLSIFATETDGATFRRKNTATLPSTTYNNSDWDIIDYVGTNKADCSSNDYSDIGIYNFISGTPPTVAIPSYTATCKTATLSVSGTEGYNGSSPADTKELTYQWLVSAPNATGWTEIADNTNYNGSSTITLSIANISTVINYQYYCQIRENTNTCYTASNAIKINDGTITWNSTDWRDVNNVIAIPSLDKLAIINMDYDTSTKGSFSACSVVVNSGKTLTITANEYVKIQNDLTNNGTVNIKTDGSLVQINDTDTNTGIITYERIVPVIRSTDYTYWSSPVLSQNLQTFSVNTPSNKFYSFNAAAVPEDWKSETPSSVSMDKGVGYCIYGPQMATPPAFFVASFIGKPNNGLIPVTIKFNGAVEGTSNLIGNPYPSAIDADKFLFINKDVIEGTIYFWTHNTDLQLRAAIIASGATPGTGALAYTSDDYASYNSTGGTAGSGESAISDPNHSVLGVDLGKIPNGKIAAGQAFFTTSLTTTANSTAIFNNSMRIDNLGKIMDNSQFFKTRNPKTKTTAIEKHRIWLNLTNPQGVFKQTLIGYITDATNQYDTRFDGISFDGNEFVDFYSVNQDKNLVIQGRTLPFDENDEVPLGFRTSIDGTFTINIDQTDGILTNQDVFIEDKLTNTTFDLRSGPFTFNTAAGTFNDRFVLRYTNKTLGTTNFDSVENQVLVSNKNKQIKVNSKAETIDKVAVYDLLGRQLFKKEKVNSDELTIANLVSSQQTLLIKVILQNGQTVTKKIIF